MFNDPTDFVDEMVRGFVAASARWVRPVEGGVVRRQAGRPGEVAVVVGGGSGHYPAFCGLVGSGLAHGAVVGNVFASPSSQQVCSVARAADNGGGVLLAFGNYTGDVLNFTAAQRVLRTEGIACEIVTVNDDVASAPATERERRRGIAGDLVVFRAAAAAAEAGRTLPEVAGAAELANKRTRSFGVAFGGCVLPGADRPLFTLPDGRMAIGMGIHGEPGIAQIEVPTADDLANLLVDRLFAERPDATETSHRVAVLVNGLGAVKYEELFLLYGCVARRLEAEGCEILDPEVGELCTSFDMAGVSLTICWLDDELERYWRTPADAPGYRKRRSHKGARVGSLLLSGVERELPESSPQCRAAAAVLVAALEEVAAEFGERAAELGKLDAVAGDGDHGAGMRRGAAAALDAARHLVSRGAGVRTALEGAAEAWADRGGGTSGALWGAALRAAAEQLSDVRPAPIVDVLDSVAAAAAAVQSAGGAALGDKTMLDAWLPFSEALENSYNSTGNICWSWAAAVEVAEKSALATAGIVSRVGRARLHGERSIGTPDPGAVSFVLVTKAVERVLRAAGDGEPA